MSKVDRWMRVAMAGLLTVFIGTVVEAATLEVGPSGYEYTSIQDAINAAVSGVDEVLVHDGTYMENIVFIGKAITVRSENGQAYTIIDGDLIDSVVSFIDGEGNDSVLDGFLLRNGMGFYFMGGGGILCESSSPTIINCRISGNECFDDFFGGGGIACTYGSAPKIINCTITGNNSPMGGGISCESSSPIIVNCTIGENRSYDFPGGGIFSGNFSSPTVINSILWGNDDDSGPNQVYVESGSSIDITYSDIEGGWTGAGNINADPLFVWPVDVNYVPTEGGNYHLGTGSPCIDAANSDSPAPAGDAHGNARYDDSGTPNTGTGANGDYYDMGAYEFTGSACEDLDGDGSFAVAGCGTGVDCDDQNPFRSPDLTEICDGWDNDCNGEIDDGFPMTTYYRDFDIDGYGDPNTPRDICMQIVGYVLDNTDCNDNDNSINPGETEACDGVDNDCNAATLDGAGEPWLGAGCDGPDSDLCEVGYI